MNPGRKAFVWCGLLLTVVATALLARRSDDGEASIAQARRELRTGNAETALKIAQQLLNRDPDSTGAVQVAAMAHADLGHHAEAATMFMTLADGSRSARETLFSGAENFVSQGKLSQSELLLRKCLELFPEDVQARRRLAGILNSGGRRWDAVRHGMVCVARQQFSVTELLLWGNPEEPYSDQDLLLKARRLSPNDPLVMTGLAVAAIKANDISTATTLLEQVTALDPAALEPQAILGGLLLDKSDFARVISWNKSLPATASDHSEIWFVRGRWAQLTKQHEAAARCYWESARRAPESRRANFQLGQQLTELARAEEAEPFLERAERLARLYELMRPIYFEGPKSDSMLQVARLMESLGRQQEALAWYYAVTRFAPQERVAAESMSRLEKALANHSLFSINADSNPAIAIDLTALPLPFWRIRDNSLPAAVQTPGSWFFPDVAASAGIHFRYFNSDDPQTEGKRMFETTGGGVAVADFDMNGWPDVYLTQGCRWPQVATQTEFPDHHYRNLGSGRFQECAEVSGLIDSGYGQGTSAGDFDNDGFPDLYVANIGQNRLFRNNGDGTFEDVTVSTGLVDESWTTSCALTDLDGDGLPDLYDANYLSGEEAFETICGTHHPRTCSPASFNGALQRICRNQGDGTWRDVTVEFGLGGLEGKALGVVSARLTDSPVTDLLIANDGEANFFFRASEVLTDGHLTFQETAVHSGLAFDRDGLAQACMGIAVDDVNGDSRLDFFITNFYEESNTLYVQKPGLLFADETREAGLRTPSLLMLGFGTQFLDGDLDGLPDLVVANGHVDDFSFDGKAYRMPPQYFRNAGGGQFLELTPERTDSYFSGEYLGRGLARIDWNRDGREDFIVSHLDAPAALAANESSQCGNSLTIRLVGVQSSRDAVGTNVTVISAGRSRTRQLTAGDGYQASNERILVFGLADAEEAEEVVIQWPSGTEQSLKRLAAGFEYRVIEGRPSAAAVPLEPAIHK